MRPGGQVLILHALVACGSPGDGYSTATSPTSTSPLVDDHAAVPVPATDRPWKPRGDGGTEITEPLLGFVGSPCRTEADCPYDGGVCLTEAEGFPGGTCSVACEQFCPDAVGYPTTLCAEAAALPPAVSWLGDGGCVQRCDFGAYPGTGCRQDYGCVQATRANTTDTRTHVCLPNVPSDLSPCLADLAARGVPFSPTIIEDRSPDTHPGLTCHVEEPIAFGARYLGVDIVYHDGDTPSGVNGSCTLGHALADTLEGLSSDVVTLRHLGTTVCRVIADTDTLSRHSYGDAIDIWGFDFRDGTTVTLEDHWEHDTVTHETVEGAWLYDTAYGWHDDQVWNIILTPDYNLAHDNHFHVDLTPGSDFIGIR